MLMKVEFDLLNLFLESLSEYLNFFFFTIVKPRRLDHELRQWENNSSRFHLRFPILITISILIGSVLQNYTPGGPPVEEILFIILLHFVFWILLSILVYLPLRILEKEIQFQKVLSLCLLIISVGYVISSLLALIVGVFVPSGIYLYFLIQTFFLWIYFPLCLSPLLDSPRKTTSIIAFILYNIPIVFLFILFSLYFYWGTGQALNPIATITPTPTITVTPPTPTITNTLTPTITPTPTITGTPPTPTITKTLTPTITPIIIPCEPNNDDSTYLLPCEYKVEYGDSYFWIAGKIYNDQSLSIPIMNHNRDKDGVLGEFKEGTKLVMLLENKMRELPFDDCLDECGTSEFPCIYRNEDNKTYRDISIECYGGQESSNFIDINNTYLQEDGAIIIPRMAVNPRPHVKQLLEEFQGYLEERRPDLAFERLHSRAYISYINDPEFHNGKGYNEVYMEGLWRYYCIIPVANAIYRLSGDYQYWQAEVDIYRCKNTAGEETSQEIQDNSIEYRKACIVVEDGKWKVDQWINKPGVYCPAK